MADIRINALANTATTPASDDYLALDGAAQGTRKILATNIANNVTDVILGASGPSVKSSLSARAPRQGLVFNGTFGATVANVPALGTTYTIAAWVNPANVSGVKVVVGTATQNPLNISDADVYSAGGAAGLTVSSGKNQLIVLSVSSGTVTPYLNTIAGSSYPDSTNVTAPISIGSNNTGTGYPWNGTISVLIYNRALSASEVVALYEAGAPAGADYNSASNTSLVASAFTTRPSYVYTTFSGASATGFTAADSSGTKVAQGGTTFTVQKNSTYLVTFTATLTSGSVPAFRLWNSSTLADVASFGPTITAGSNSFVLTGSTTDTSVIAAFVTAGATSYAISNFSVTALGLLLAPDAAQAGGGLVWYDTSGNAANISWTSGVSWNVPSSRYLGGNWTTSGNLTVSGGGATFGASGGGDAVLSLKRASDGLTVGNLTVNTSSSLLNLGTAYTFLTFSTEGTEKARFSASTGNFLIGKTIDSSNGKLQLADHTTSAGGIGFGTGMALYLTSTYDISLDALAGNPILRFRNAGTEQFRLESSGSQAYFTASNSIIMRSAGVTALTLDSSQNAEFMGTVKVNNKGIVKSADNVNIGTSATTIFTLSGIGGASFCFVCGDNGTAGFADLVVTVGNGEAVTVISSATIYGSPAARTYTTSGTSLKLAMASGVMNVRTTAIYTA